MVRNDFAQQLRPVAGRHARYFCMKRFSGTWSVKPISKI
jgi:hypothetical protein